MMTAVNYLTVFQEAKRSGNTLAVLPKRATQEHRVTGVTMKPAKQSKGRGHREMARQNGQRGTAQRVAAIMEPEAVLASCFAGPAVATHPLRQPAWGCAHNTSRRNGLGRFADR